MKRYIKSVKWSGANNPPVKSADESCKGDSIKCQLCIEETIHKCLLSAEEGRVEWEICNDSVAITRIVCRTIVWLALIGLSFHVAIMWFK